eukprot:gnl/MRDRNA2_/MRDRNA2_15716_c0_seq1.p1 gnl/MRDRNA2_/MRDRNA2_15716_c0~~gnl/MRDRNA2_/MRDRNA2_15716_c0_seq1.p1  ORF type:complete len:429 (+),score=78.10 gnl/MRDRNA2_/MRDRNA2_15716_c0_seq1:2-1288(+)
MGFEQLVISGLKKMRQNMQSCPPEQRGMLLKWIGCLHSITGRIESINSISFIIKSKDSSMPEGTPITVHLKNTSSISFLRWFDRVLVNCYQQLGLSDFETIQKDDLLGLYNRKVSRLAACLQEVEFPTKCMSPSQLDVFKSNLHIYNNPELMLMLGEQMEDPFYRLVKCTLEFMDMYLERGLEEWVLDQNGQPEEDATGENVGEACMQAYTGVHAMIRAQENDAYQDRIRVVSEVKWNEFRYDDSIDQISSRALRVITLYRQCQIMRMKYFESLIHDTANKAGGIPHVAPLKGFLRVAEKLAMRPQSGVPWDICRAQIECEHMEQLTKALVIITQDPMVKMLGINDRFKNPKGGWCDISLYFCIDDPECSQVVAEVQLVHYKLMKVREEFGAHDAYNGERFQAEFALLKGCLGKRTNAGLPWSLRTAT